MENTLNYQEIIIAGDKILDEIKYLTNYSFEDNHKQIIEKINKLNLSVSNLIPIIKYSLQFKSNELIVYQNKVGFWDKFLFGIFGDHSKVESVERIKKVKKEIEDKLDKLHTYKSSHLLRNLSIKEKNIAHEQLLNSNDKYKNDINNINVIEKYLLDLIILKDLIKTALDDIDSAEFTETLDLVSSNKAISLISMVDNSNANSSIKNVSKKLKELKENYNFESMDLDTIDTIFDLVLDNFAIDSIMSIFVLQELSNMKDKVEELEKMINSKISNIENTIKSLKQNTDSYLNENLTLKAYL